MISSTFTYQSEAEVVEAAHEILASMARCGDISLCKPADASGFFRTQIATQEREVFSVAFLDSQYRLITCDILFQGSVNRSAIYPREVVKASLKHNAAALVVAHNHPSGVAEPSDTDRRITDRLKEALELVDVLLLDHLVVSKNDWVSLAERGMI